jgi:hypothetical protein
LPVFRPFPPRLPWRGNGPKDGLFSFLHDFLKFSQKVLESRKGLGYID